MANPKFHIEHRSDSHWLMPKFHFHQYCEFFLPLTASGTLHIGEQAFPFAPNTLFFLGSNILHRCETSQPHERFLLQIAPESLEALSTMQTDFRKLSQAPQRNISLSPEEASTTIAYMEALLSQENDGSFGSDIHQTIALLELLIYLTPLFQIPQKETQYLAKDLLRVSPILDYIQENLDEPLSLDQISSSFYVSKHHLCRLFKATTGYTVLEYITNCRVAKARLLLEQGFSVQRAGELSGFSDNSHFIRTFGKLNGISPGKYAKNYPKNT